MKNEENTMEYKSKDAQSSELNSNDRLAEDMPEWESFDLCHKLGWNMVATAFGDHEYRVKWLKRHRPDLFTNS